MHFASRNLRRALTTAAVLALAIVAACDSGTRPARSVSAGPAHVATAASAAPRPSCPSTEFEGFARRFADDIALQKGYTATPLRMRAIDATAEPEPAPVVRMVAKDEIRFPVVPTRAERNARGLVMTFDTATSSMVLAVPDTDDKTTYRFDRGACWTLRSVESDAL